MNVVAELQAMKERKGESGDSERKGHVKLAHISISEKITGSK